MRDRGLPRAVRIMLANAAIGIPVGAVFVSGLMLLDGGGIGALLWRVGGIEAIGLLWLFSAMTFGSALMGGAVMAIGDGQEQGPVRGSRAPAGLLPLRIARRHPRPN